MAIGLEGIAGGQRRQVARLQGEDLGCLVGLSLERGQVGWLQQGRELLLHAVLELGDPEGAAAELDIDRHGHVLPRPRLAELVPERREPREVAIHELLPGSHAFGGQHAPVGEEEVVRQDAP